MTSIRQHVEPFYSAIGRSSADRGLMVGMLLIGYRRHIRFERRLFGKARLNLACRWFCRLGLDGRVPDHSTISKNRHRRFRGNDLPRGLFGAAGRRCTVEGIVGGQGFAVDAGMVRTGREPAEGRR